MRRVIIVEDGGGQSRIAGDEQLGGMKLPGAGQLWRLWSADSIACSKVGVDPNATGLYPPAGGLRYSALEIPPRTEVKPEISPEDADARELEAHRFAEAGMHQTKTIDFDIVISGTILLELGDGSKTLLHPGDVVINNGTKHKWSNPGLVSATLAGVVIGVQF